MKKTTANTPEGNFESITQEELSSLEVSKTAKGDYTYTLKLYFEGRQWGPILEDQERVKAWFEAKFGKREAYDTP